MNKRDLENLKALEQLVDEAISYVGQANYRERESHAHRVITRGFADFKRGDKPAWFEDDSENEDEDDE